VAVLLFLGSALVLALLPWLGPRLHHEGPAPLRTRLALALALAAALPLVVTVTVVVDRQERMATDAALARAPGAEGALGQEVADYVDRYRAAAVALAALLRAVREAYPDAVLFATLDVDGAPLARSAELPLPGAPDRGVPQGTRRDGTTVALVDTPSGAGVWVDAPLRDAPGRY